MSSARACKQATSINAKGSTGIAKGDASEATKNVSGMRDNVTYINNMPRRDGDNNKSVVIRQLVAASDESFANMYSRFAGMTITVNAAPALMVNNKVVVGRCNKFLQLRLSGSGSFTKLFFIVFHFLNNGNKNAN